MIPAVLLGQRYLAVGSGPSSANARRMSPGKSAGPSAIMMAPVVLNSGSLLNTPALHSADTQRV